MLQTAGLPLSIALQSPGGATPFNSGGAALVNTGAAAITLKAAVSGKRMWLTAWRVVNITVNEYPILELTEDPAGTPVVLDRGTPAQNVTTSPGEFVHVFDPPLLVSAGMAVGYQARSATGDCFSSIQGYIET